MKVTPALDEAHFNETIPVMAALSVFATACGKGGLSGSGMLYLAGAELVKDAATCEIDFMVMIQDSELPAIVIGEAKAGHPERPAPGDLLSGGDLEHLQAIQDALRRIGIDCWICFATTPRAAATRDRPAATFLRAFPHPACVPAGCGPCAARILSYAA